MHQSLQRAAVILWIIATPALAGSRLYYTNDNGIKAVDLPGGPTLTVQTTSYDSRPMWVKAHGNALYWSIFEGGQIWTSNLDGTNAKVLIQQPHYAYLRNIEFANGKIYWAAEGLGAIYRADLDGQNIQPTGITASYPRSPVDFEIYNNHAYWVSWYGAIMSSNLDGTDANTFSLTGIAGEADAIEIHDGMVYIAADGIYAAPLTGGPTTRLSTRTPTGMDIFDGRLYFNDAFSGIYSMPLTGGPDRLEAQGYAWQLTVIPEPATLAFLAIAPLFLARRRP